MTMVEKVPQEFCINVRCLVATLVFLACVCTAAVVAIIVLKTEDSSLPPSKSEDVPPEVKYRKFLRTPEEQREFELSLYNAEVAAHKYKNDFVPCAQSENPWSYRNCSDDIPPCHKEDNGSPWGTANATAGQTTPTSTTRRTPPPLNGSDTPAFIPGTARRRRQAVRLRFPVVYHACCISQRKFIQPTEAITIAGQIVNVLQADGLGQYFSTYKCQKDSQCSVCTCLQGVEYHHAAVQNKTTLQYSLAWIVLKGCCKCVNL